MRGKQSAGIVGMTAAEILSYSLCRSAQLFDFGNHYTVELVVVVVLVARRIEMIR